MLYILSSKGPARERRGLAPESVEATQTMTTSSTARQAADEPAAATGPSSTSIREYRRHRKHLFPLDAYKATTAVGGIVIAYCGLVQEVPKGNPADVEEVSGAGREDCVTCVDLWLCQKWVRL